MGAMRYVSEHPRRVANGFASWICAAAACAFCLASFPILASGQDLSVKELQRTVWTEKDGVPEKTWAMTQTTDGWMWFGGPSGLYRFDGIRFEPVAIDSGDGSSTIAITELYAGPSGELFIGMGQGGMSMLKNGKLTHFDDQDARRSGEIFTFGTDAEGALWAMASTGAMRFDGHQWELVGNDWGYPGGAATGMALDQNRTLWVATTKEILRLPKGSHKFEVTGTKVDRGADFIRSPDGKIWLYDFTGVRLLPGQSEASPIDASPVSRESTIAFFDAEGYLWSRDASVFKTWHGKAVVDLESIGTDLSTGFVDRDGDIWLGSIDRRIVRIRRPIVKSAGIARQRGWVTFATDSSGRIWIAIANSENSGISGVWTFDSGPSHVQPDEIPSASTIVRSRDGAIWIGGSGGLWRKKGDRFQPAVALPEAARREIVKGLSPDCAGGLWVSVEGIGLLQHDGTRWKENGGVPGLPSEAPSAQACDSTGRLWLGYRTGRVFIVDKGQSKMFNASDGLQVGPVFSLWVGTSRTLVAGERGLAMLRGKRFLTLVAADRLAFEQVGGIAETKSGDVWLNGPRGAVHIAAADLDSFHGTTGSAAIPVELFDASDGYPAPGYSRVLSSPSIAVAGDGRAWLVGASGIAWIDSQKIRRDVVAPPVLIQSLTAESVRHDDLGQVNLAKGTRSLEIDYTALNYSHPDRLRFRYRLDGVDDGWVSAGARRQAFYSNLGPGSYRFLVNVTDERGAWTSSSATLDFVIPPTFVQSRFFLALCTVVGMALLSVAYRLRVRQIERSQRRLLDERLAERERIARELHDTLLQGTQALILDVHRAATLLSRGELPPGLLEGAMTRGEEVVAEGRSRIEDLRGDLPLSVDLARSLTTLGEEQALGTAVQFHAATEGTARTMAPRAAPEAHRIGREAILNAFHHAQATSIELRIEYTHLDFRLCVSDDGAGIDSRIIDAGSRAGHWGIPGMRERARSIGATLEIQRNSGGGTVVELCIPAAIAYPKSIVPARWRRIFLRAERGGYLGADRRPVAGSGPPDPPLG